MSPRSESNDKLILDLKSPGAGTVIRPRLDDERSPLLDLAVGGDQRKGVNATFKDVEFVDAKRPRGLGWPVTGSAMVFSPRKGSVSIEFADSLAGVGAFTLECLVRPREGGGKRMNLVEGQQLPAALMLLKGDDGYLPAVSVRGRERWQTVQATTPVAFDEWTLVSAVWTGRELHLFVDAEHAGRATLEGPLQEVGDLGLVVGTWVDGARNRLVGDVGGVRLWDGIPSWSKGRVPGGYGQLVEEAQVAGKGVLDDVIEQLSAEGISLGESQGPSRAVGRGQMRSHAQGAVFWTPEWGGVGLTGPIAQRYAAIGGPAGVLGYPRTGVVAARVRGSLVTYFDNGAMLWSAATGAHEVAGLTYVHYRALGGEGSFVGLPTTHLGRQGGGEWQRFTAATLYHSRGSGTFEVHGAIRDHYHALGGPGSFLGFPLSDETPVYAASGGVIGRLSRFQGGTIYWSSRTGAFEVHGSIRLEYERLGGPAGSLGFPTTDETRRNGSTGETRYNGFERGVIVWRGGVGARAITQLRYHLGTVTSSAIDDGYEFLGRDRTAELVTYSSIWENEVAKLSRSRSPSGHAGSSHHIDREYRVTRITPETRVRIKVDVDDWDKASSNDWIGTLDRTFDIGDWWGLLGGSPGGVYSNVPATSKSGDAPRLDTLQFDLSVSDASGVDPAAPYRRQMHWRFDNFSTPTLTRQQYVDTFRDVDNTAGLWDRIRNPFDTAYYELAYKSSAAKGNCFGLSLEEVLARSSHSVFQQPLHSHVGTRGDSANATPENVVEAVRSIVNEKHGYQLGASAIDWVIGRLLTLDAVRPLSVYQQVKRHLARQDWPVLCMVDLGSGSGHCVVPYGYVDGAGSAPHRILVADPNVVERRRSGDPTYIEIGKDDSFRFLGSSLSYASSRVVGDLLPGTLLLDIPMHRLCDIPRTPFWEVLLAVSGLMGFVLLVAGDGEVDQLTVDGRRLFGAAKGTGSPSSGRARAGSGMTRVPLLDADGPLPELYVGRGLASTVSTELRGRRSGTMSHQLFAARSTAVYVTESRQGTVDGLRLSHGENGAVRCEAASPSRDKMADIALTRPELFPRSRSQPTALSASVHAPFARGAKLAVGLAPDNSVLIEGLGEGQEAEITLRLGEGRKARQNRLVLRAAASGEVLRVQPSALVSTPSDSTIFVERLSHRHGLVLARLRARLG